MQQQVLSIVGWMLWAALAYTAFSYWFGIIYSIRHRRPFMNATFAQVVLFTALLTFLWLTPEVSKLHIIWAAPLLFYGARYFTTLRPLRRTFRRK